MWQYIPSHEIEWNFRILTFECAQDDQQQYCTQTRYGSSLRLLLQSLKYLEGSFYYKLKSREIHRISFMIKILS